jgi:hypothetical protein
MARICVFADEAGDFAFNRQGGSRYFIIGSVTMEDCSIGADLLELRRQLALEDKLRQGYAEFHASEDRQAIRNAVFDCSARTTSGWTPPSWTRPRRCLRSLRITCASTGRPGSCTSSLLAQRSPGPRMTCSWSPQPCRSTASSSRSRSVRRPTTERQGGPRLASLLGRAPWALSPAARRLPAASITAGPTERSERSDRSIQRCSAGQQERTPWRLTELRSALTARPCGGFPLPGHLRRTRPAPTVWPGG